MSDIAADVVDVKPETNTRGWKFFVDEINKTWRKGAANFILPTGHLLNDAKDELSREAYSAVLKQLHFNTSTAKKLICIAKNTILSSHVNSLPPNYSTLYVLSQLGTETLLAALADGSIHPGMQRKDATALKPKKTPADNNTDSSSSETETASHLSQLNTAWKFATNRQRAEFLDQLDLEGGLLSAMSGGLLANFRDRVIGVSIAGASKSTKWAVDATDKLHSALRIAEQQERDGESVDLLIGALRCIALTAERRGIARSDIVLAQGKSREGKK